MFDISKMTGDLVKLCRPGNLFESYRLVNPDNHSVFDLSGNGSLIRSEEKCFEIWGKNRPCQNCVSRKACSTRQSFMKLEYLAGKALLVFSEPTVFSGTPYALELVKDVSCSMLVSNTAKGDNSDLTHIISEFNTLATTETFTGLYNRAYIENEIESRIKYRPEQSFAVVIVDIDNFKSVNDRFGHAVGDSVLLRVAELFRATEHECGCKVARYGGDEFVIIFDENNENTVSRIMDALGKTFHSYELTSENTRFSSSFSYGVSITRADDTAESVISRADSKMYEMKKKNRV